MTAACPAWASAVQGGPTERVVGVATVTKWLSTDAASPGTRTTCSGGATSPWDGLAFSTVHYQLPRRERRSVPWKMTTTLEMPSCVEGMFWTMTNPSTRRRSRLLRVEGEHPQVVVEPAPFGG